MLTLCDLRGKAEAEKNLVSEMTDEKWKEIAPFWWITLERLTDEMLIAELKKRGYEVQSL